MTSENKHEDRLVLKADEMAKQLGICTRTLSGLVADGKIPSVQIGRCRRFIAVEVLAALKSMSTN